jgi:hypothetical protein
MSDLLKAARLGLEYAEQVLAERKLDLAGCPHKWEREQADVDAIRTAIEAAEKVQPVAWRYKPMVGSPWSITDDGYYISCKRDQGYCVEPLYAAAPTPVQPLTDEQIDAAIMAHPSPVYALMATTSMSGETLKQALRMVGRAVEAAHGIKEIYRE